MRISILICVFAFFLSLSSSQLVQAQEEPTIILKDSMECSEDTLIDDPIFYIEEMPLFRGQPAETFQDYLQENICYPEDAYENSIDGKVFVRFVVNEEGGVEDIQVIRGVDPALDLEAVRVIKSSPGWTPGKQQGKPVKVTFTYPIVFKLE